jgi:hypothetical protein
VPPGEVTSTAREAPPNAAAANCGGAGARARRFGRTDAALPNQDAYVVRRLDGRQFDIGAFGKKRVHGERPGNCVQTRLGRGTEHDTLRISDAQYRRGDRGAIDVERLLPQFASVAPSRRET